MVTQVPKKLMVILYAHIAVSEIFVALLVFLSVTLCACNDFCSEMILLMDIFCQYVWNQLFLSV